MTKQTKPAWFKKTLAALVRKEDLAAVEMCEAMESMLDGEVGDVETTALLVALAMKGETGQELAAAAAVLRDHMQTLDFGTTDLLDTCGTGGDDRETFNISTAAALVAAGAGVPVVKHGNHAMTGRVGSADVLAELGVNIQSPALASSPCLKKAGMVFCLAPAFHPSMKQVAELRRRLGIRTIFNCLGPLANPANAGAQVVGVGRMGLLEKMADALARLGTRHALVVHGHDGLDEVSLTGSTHVIEVRQGNIKRFAWTPQDFRLESCSLSELQADSPSRSASMIREILDGRDTPAARVVVVNAAAALIAADRVITPREGARRALESIKQGKAARVLDSLIEISQAGVR